MGRQERLEVRGSTFVRAELTVDVRPGLPDRNDELRVGVRLGRTQGPVQPADGARLVEEDGER